MHKKITTKRLIRAIEDDSMIGFCKACGAEREMCEPDARNYPCDNCGKREVFGAEELLMEVA